MDSDTPTATDLARDIVIKWNQDFNACPCAECQVNAANRSNELLAALAAQGVTLAGPGQVVVSAESIHAAIGWSSAIPLSGWTDDDRRALIEFRAALSGTTDDQPADRARPTEDDK